MEARRPDVDDVIAHKYQLVRRLGRGSMGEVWLAHHKTLREDVAVKLLTPAPGTDSDADPFCGATRFRFEAQVAARLSRKTRHIVRVTDHGEDEGVAYLVMELLEGITLENKLMRIHWMAPDAVRTILRQIGRALEHAHAEGVLHRDLKPSNVFLTEDEDKALLIKVLDFGIARVVHAHLSMVPFSTGRGLVFGTPGYMSPEQARGKGGLDTRCDLWALATIAYEALSGELPIEGASPTELLASLCAARTVPVRRYRPDLPLSVETFFERAFSENIDARFTSAIELVEAFDRACGSSPGARLEGSPEAPYSPTLLSRTNEEVLTAARARQVTRVELPRRALGPARAWARSKRANAIGLLLVASGAATMWCARARSPERPTVTTVVTAKPPPAAGVSSTARALLEREPEGAAQAGAMEERKTSEEHIPTHEPRTRELPGAVAAPRPVAPTEGVASPHRSSEANIRGATVPSVEHAKPVDRSNVL